MAKPYYLVAYGHVLRVSERCDSKNVAIMYCFGIPYDERSTTTFRMEGTSWGYRSQKDKQEFMRELAIEHKKRTGYTLCGFERETRDIFGPGCIRVFSDKVAVVKPDPGFKCPKCGGTCVSERGNEWDCKKCGRCWFVVGDDCDTLAKAEAYLARPTPTTDS